MEIIRDEETFGLMMIPLFVDWGVRRCNVKDCTSKPSTIVTGAHPEANVFGLCEEHFQGFREAGVLEATLIFDDFDAFAKKEEE